MSLSPGQPRRATTVPLAETRDVIEYNQRISTVQSTEQATREIRQFQERQRLLEEQFLSKSHPCKVSQIQKFQDNLGGVNPDKYKQIISDQFYDPAVMRAAMCVADSIFYTQPIQSGAVAANQRIREWIRNLRQIGAESVEGYALRADFEDADSVFIVKAPRNPENAELIHELFVGIQLNSLRSLVPNFAYVFGGFKCSPPVIDATKDVVAWCNNTAVSVHYVLYENIAPAKSMREYVANCTFSQWLDKYLQILYALNIAQEKKDFTHYDLHDENVLVRDIGENSFSIPYETERNGTEYLLTDGIATVIDYGFSHVQYKGQHYGVWDKMAWGVFPRRSFPLHDAYKLLLMSMRSMKAAGNTDCYNGATQILRFFNSAESADQIVEQQAQTYYFLPYSEATGSKTMFDLTRYIRENIPIADQIVRAQPGTERLIGCAGTDVCITGQETVRRVGAVDPMTVDTVFEFYDLVTRLSEEGRSEDVQQVVKSFNYNDILPKTIREYNVMVEELNRIVGSMNIISIKGLPVDNLFDAALLAQYKESAAKVADLYDHIQDLSLHKDAIKYVSQFYNGDAISKALDEQYAEVQKHLITLQQGVASLQDDDQYLKGLSQTQGTYINRRVAQDRQFLWWWKGLPSVLMVFA